MGWFKNQMMALAVALSNVEKNTLSQVSENSNAGLDMTQRKTQGTIWDALINGEMTEEVKLFRARIYKVTEAMNKVVVSVKGYDENGYPIYDITAKDDAARLKKHRVDTTDKYTPEVIFHNKLITKGLHETSNSVDDEGEPALIIMRDFLPRFLLEKYTHKVIVRKITDQEKLVEFYILKTPAQFQTNSKFFLTFFKKIMKDLKHDFFKINSIEFMTGLDDIGVDESYLVELDIKDIVKVVEFDEYYVVKYNAKLTNFEDTKEFFTDENLDKLYEQKAPRKKLK